MSFREVGWVLDHSPYTLGTRLVHIVLAERANEDHDWELWYSIGTVAKKAKVSRRTVASALAQMRHDGMLAVVDDASGKPTRYRFLMPTPADSAYPTPADSRAQPAQIADPLLLLAKEDKKTRAPFEDDFAAAWQLYPRKVDRKGALRCYTATRRRGVAAERLQGAVVAFAAAMRAEARPAGKILHGSTFFGPDERWQDYGGDAVVVDGPGSPPALSSLRVDERPEVGPDWSADDEARRVHRERVAALRTGT
jgi:hypothetical protein